MMRHVWAMLFVVFCQNANAGTSKRVYYIQDAEKPVVISKGTVQGSGLMMRDPNLGGTATAIAPKVARPTTRKTTKIIPAPKTKSALAFKPLRVGATVRMPRVEFGRVALPVGIREDIPAPDFIGRSLEQEP